MCFQFCSILHMRILKVTLNPLKTDELGFYNWKTSSTFLCIKSIILFMKFTAFTYLRLIHHLVIFKCEIMKNIFHIKWNWVKKWNNRENRMSNNNQIHYLWCSVKIESIKMLRNCTFPVFFKCWDGNEQTGDPLSGSTSLSIYFLKLSTLSSYMFSVPVLCSLISN